MFIVKVHILRIDCPLVNLEIIIIYIAIAQGRTGNQERLKYATVS